MPRIVAISFSPQSGHLSGTLNLPVPNFAKAYYIDERGNYYLSGGAPSFDFPVYKDNLRTRGYLFSLKHNLFPSNDSALVTVTNSLTFSDLNSSTYIDPRFDSDLFNFSLSNIAIAFWELKVRQAYIAHFSSTNKTFSRICEVSPVSNAYILKYRKYKPATKASYYLRFLPYPLSRKPKHFQKKIKLYKHWFIYFKSGVTPFFKRTFWKGTRFTEISIKQRPKKTFLRLCDFLKHKYLKSTDSFMKPYKLGIITDKIASLIYETQFKKESFGYLFSPYYHKLIIFNQLFLKLRRQHQLEIPFIRAVRRSYLDDLCPQPASFSHRASKYTPIERPLFQNLPKASFDEWFSISRITKLTGFPINILRKKLNFAYSNIHAGLFTDSFKEDHANTRTASLLVYNLRSLAKERNRKAMFKPLKHPTFSFLTSS